MDPVAVGSHLEPPADRVLLVAAAAAELSAAVQAALDNVRRHAGPAARVLILLEDENDGVRVTVRDDGAGFAPGRLTAPPRSTAGPGEGTEVEFRVPRR